MKNEVVVVGLEKKFGKFEDKIRRAAFKILKIIKKNGVAVEIFLAGNKEMRRLNRKFRGKDKVADVLSFEEPKNFIVYPRPKFKKIGEVYLNMERCGREPSVAGRGLLIHGIIHLFGYNHKRKNDRIKMEKIEKYVHNSFRHRFVKN